MFAVPKCAFAMQQPIEATADKMKAPALHDTCPLRISQAKFVKQFRFAKLPAAQKCPPPNIVGGVTHCNIVRYGNVSHGQKFEREENLCLRFLPMSLRSNDLPSPLIQGRNFRDAKITEG